MKVAIYQIDRSKDVNKFCFEDYDRVVRIQGNKHIDKKIYDKVFEGNVECTNLEDVYIMFNINQPCNFKGRSLSISDMVEVVESNAIKIGYYYCDRLGFRKVKIQ